MITLEPLIIEIKPSKLLRGEIGVFSARYLEKDFVVAEAAKLGETFFEWSEFEAYDSATQAKLLRYCLQTDDGFYAPTDLNYMTVPWNMNHSCFYNIGFDEDGNFVTSRPIEPDAELTWDYGMGFSYSLFKLKCKCYSTNCRKVITGNDWKDPGFREKNKTYFLRELLNKAKNL